MKYTLLSVSCVLSAMGGWFVANHKLEVRVYGALIFVISIALGFLAAIIFNKE